MSRADLFSVVGRARLDLTFGGQLAADFDRALVEGHYQLDAAEREEARQALAAGAPAATLGAGGMPEVFDARFREEKAKERFTAQQARMLDMNRFTLDLFKSTLSHATRTFKTITWMNTLMFAAGLGLFLFAAFYAVFSQQKIYSLVFGGLGAASFVALFLLGPIDKTQVALSNLVQVEIAFMNFFEQITFWEGYGMMPTGNPPMPDPARIEKASAELQRRTQEVVELLERYLESKTPPPPVEPPPA